MMQFSNTNVKMKLLKDHDDTFLFHQLQNDASTDHAIRLASYFNKQTKGFRIKDISTDLRLNKLIEPLATFDGSGRLLSNMSFVDQHAKPY
jgi:hypothetical protein